MQRVHIVQTPRERASGDKALNNVTTYHVLLKKKKHRWTVYVCVHSCHGTCTVPSSDLPIVFHDQA